MDKYTVKLRTKPGPYAQYVTTFTVWADDEEEAVRKAKIRTLRDFPDYGGTCWKAEEIRKGD